MGPASPIQLHWVYTYTQTHTHIYIHIHIIIHALEKRHKGPCICQLNGWYMAWIYSTISSNKHPHRDLLRNRASIIFVYCVDRSYLFVPSDRYDAFLTRWINMDLLKQHLQGHVMRKQLGNEVWKLWAEVKNQILFIFDHYWYWMR